MSATVDHYNWKFPNRKDLMNLSQIDPAEIKGIPQPQFDRISSSLRNDDIPGSRPFIRGYHYLNKENFNNRSDDICPQLSPRDLTNHPSYLLKIDDIEGAQAKRKFQTNRFLDPLNPVYKLPTFVAPIHEDPKFIRDNINVDDIEGARANQDQWEGKTRNVDPYTEVQGSRPKQMKSLNQTSDQINVRDINFEMNFYTQRSTSPLDPRYVVRDNFDYNLNQTYGHVKGSHPKQLHPIAVKQENIFNLRTKDIEGAWASSLPQRVNFVEKRREYRSLTQTEDIFGAQAGTLKKGIVTMRILNPLVPQYKLLGHSESDNNKTLNLTQQQHPQKIEQVNHRSNSVQNQVSLNERENVMADIAQFEQKKADSKIQKPAYIKN